MSHKDKLASVRALIEAHNSSVESEAHKVRIEDFEKKLQGLGATSEAALAECTWEDLMECGLPKLLARTAASEFRKQAKPGTSSTAGGDDSPSFLSHKKVDRMNYEELIGRYRPDEDDLVAKKLTEISGSKPFIVLTAGVVNVAESLKFLLELRKGFPARDVALVGDRPVRVLKVGERPLDLVDENPLYPGRALRPDGTCDQTNRSWEGVRLKVRQLLWVGVSETKDVLLVDGVLTLTGAHILMDLAMNDKVNLFHRFTKAALRLEELENLGRAPTLKVALKQARSQGGRVENPFGSSTNSR
jgi:hypothetical protein